MTAKASWQRVIKPVTFDGDHAEADKAKMACAIGEAARPPGVNQHDQQQQSQRILACYGNSLSAV